MVHSGGVPDGLGMGNKFIRLHFYLPTKSQKPPPLGETIYRASSTGMYYFLDHWHTEQCDSVQAVSATAQKVNPVVSTADV